MKLINILLPTDRDVRKIVGLFATSTVIIMLLGLIITLRQLSSVTTKLQHSVAQIIQTRSKKVEALSQKLQQDFEKLSRDVTILDYDREDKIQKNLLNSTNPIRTFMRRHEDELYDIIIIGKGAKHTRFFFNKEKVLTYSYVDNDYLRISVGTRDDIYSHNFPSDKNIAYDALTDSEGAILLLRIRVLDVIEKEFNIQDVSFDFANVVLNYQNKVLRINNLETWLAGDSICHNPTMSETPYFGLRVYDGILTCGSQKFEVVGAVGETVYANKKFKVISAIRQSKVTESIENIISIVTVMFVSIFVVMCFALWAWFKQRKAKESIEEQNRAQMIHASKMTMIGEMASGVAHEINNPLAIIIGLAESTLNHIKKSGETGDPIVLDRLDRIRNTGIRMAKTVKSLRALSRDDSKIQHEEFSLLNLIENVINVSSERARNLGVEIIFQNKTLNYSILGLEAQLGQVFLNLLSNAQNAVELSEHKWIKISAEMTDEYLQIYFDDSGVGFPPELVANIEHSFFTKSNISKGSGLGLTSTVAILKEHSGRLKIIQGLGHTRVAVCIPKTRTIDPAQNVA